MVREREVGLGGGGGSGGRGRERDVSLFYLFVGWFVCFYCRYTLGTFSSIK